MIMNYIFVDKSCTTPIYKQIKTSIHDAILSGQLQQFSPLPTEEDVCRLFNINRLVVRKAYAELIKEKLVMRKKGSTPFVFNQLCFNISLHNIPFYKGAPYNFDHQIILIETIKRTESDFYHFFDKMYRIVVLFSYQHVPVFIQDIYLNFEFYHNFHINNLQLEKLSDIVEYEHRYKVGKISNFGYQIELSRFEVGLLLFPLKSSAIKVESHFYDTKENQIAVVESIYPGKYFTFIHEETHAN